MQNSDSQPLVGWVIILESADNPGHFQNDLLKCPEPGFLNCFLSMGFGILIAFVLISGPQDKKGSFL